MLLVLGNSPREERHKEKQVPHFMVTEYIQRELKSAHQTPATLQETSTFRRLKAAALPIAAELEEQRGATGFSQNECSSTDYMACISFFEC